MRKLLLFAATLLFQVFALASMPEAYKHVDRMIWVVEDLDETIQQWNNLGFTAFAEVKPQDAFYGATCEARFGEAQITFIQPESGKNCFSEFLEDNGPGVFSLVHRFENHKSRRAEVARLKKLGIQVLKNISIKGDRGKLQYTFMNTREEGTYVLGLVSGQQAEKSLLPQGPLGGSFTQYAFAVVDPTPVSDFWARIGLPKFKITHSEGPERTYYGKPAHFVMDLGWQRHGDVSYEWCIPLEGQTVYQDHIDRHSEGIQHFGWNVPDMDKAIAVWEAKGIQVASSGVWGEKGKKGSGRFAYMDTDALGGIMVELLWNYKP